MAWRTLGAGAVVLCAGMVFGGAFVLQGQSLPALHAKAIDGSTVQLLQQDGRKPVLLILGFSHKADKQFDLWKRQGFSNYLTDKRIYCLELVDMHGVPGFAVSMARHGMRKQIHGEEQSHFVPFESDDAEWKKLVGYAAPEDAYLVLAESNGHVLWQTHGLPTDAKSAELRGELKGLGVVAE